MPVLMTRLRAAGGWPGPEGGALVLIIDSLVSDASWPSLPGSGAALSAYAPPMDTGHAAG